MSALAINTFSDYPCIDNPMETIPIRENLRLEKEKHIDKCLTEIYSSYVKKSGGMNNINSDGLCVANDGSRFFLLSQVGINALGIKMHLDYLINHQIEIDEILLYIFNALEDYLLEQQYEACNSFFRLIDIDDYNEIILIGILTATYPWKEHLLARCTFYRIVKEKIDKLYSIEEARQLLCGLE